MTTRLMQNDNLCFAIKNRRVDGGNFMPHVVVQCHALGCSNRFERPAAGKVVPEHVAKDLARHGWEVEVQNRFKNRCPDCVKRQEQKRKGESPGTKVVELFGQQVTLPEAITPTPKIDRNPIYAAAHEDKPVRRFEIIMKSSRSLGDVANMLDGFGEVVLLRSAAVNPEPVTAQPTPPQPSATSSEQPAMISTPEPEEPEPLNDGKIRRGKLTFTAESMASKRRLAADSMARRRKVLCDTISNIYLQNTSITGAQMCHALNKSGVKPIGVNFADGWRTTQIARYLPELGIPMLPGMSGATPPANRNHAAMHASGD